MDWAVGPSEVPEHKSCEQEGREAGKALGWRMWTEWAESTLPPGWFGAGRGALSLSQGLSPSLTHGWLSSVQGQPGS